MINSQPTPQAEPIGVHLSPEKLFQLLSNQVSATEKQQLEDHLRTCPLCTEALEGFAGADRTTSQATLLEINHLIKKRTARRKPNTLVNDIKTWGIATAIVFLILISAAIVWNAVHTTKTPSVPATAPPTINQLGPVAVPVKGHEHFKNYLRQQQAQLSGRPANTSLRKGRVIIRFTVNPDSSLTNFKVVKSLGYATDQAALELIKKGPAWQPARQQDKVIPQQITLPITFK